MHERLVQVGPVKLIDLAVYTILDVGQQDSTPHVSNPHSALQALLSYWTLRTQRWLNLRNANTKFTTQVNDGELRKSFYIILYNFYVNWLDIVRTKLSRTRTNLLAKGNTRAYACESMWPLYGDHPWGNHRITKTSLSLVESWQFQTQIGLTQHISLKYFSSI